MRLFVGGDRQAQGRRPDQLSEGARGMTALDEDVKAELIGTVTRWVRQQVIPNASTFDHADEYPEAWVEQMKSFGLFGARIPEEYGGLGLDVPTYARVI